MELFLWIICAVVAAAAAVLTWHLFYRASAKSERSMHRELWSRFRRHKSPRDGRR